MNAVSGFILFWGVSIAGYLAGRRLKIPAPAILGPIACFLVLTILGVKFTIPAWQKPVLSVITGILLGMRFNQNFKGVLCQMLLAAIWLVSLSLIATGVLIFTGLEKETALFAATPGGMAEITLMSLSYHSDPFATVLLQSSRMICSMVVFSSLAFRYRCEETGEKKAVTAERRLKWYEWGVLLLPVLGVTWILTRFHVPVANLLGPMLVIGIAVKAGNVSCRINKRIQTLVQIGIGGLAGAAITRESILGFPEYIFPVIILNILVITGSLLLARIMMWMTNWDKATCILACCPAGLSPTIMIAMEYKADANIVTLFQVLRMVTVLVSTPFLAKMLIAG